MQPHQISAHDILLVSEILLGYEEALWPKLIIGDKSCQSNSDKRLSDFASFLVM